VRPVVIPPEMIQPEISPMKIPLMAENEFDGVIENFEKNLQYWSMDYSTGSFLNKVNISNYNIGEFKFKAIYCSEEYHPDISIIRYRRKMDFSPYKGIRFIARGTRSALYKIKIYEREEYFRDFDVDEIWYRKFRVNNEWNEFRILFKDMEVEEYWEQDYVSDNLQVFTNITGIAITAQNMASTKPIRGTLYIDNIELY